jgi:hypothetical protein
MLGPQQLARGREHQHLGVPDVHDDDVPLRVERDPVRLPQRRPCTTMVAAPNGAILQICQVLAFGFALPAARSRESPISLSDRGSRGDGPGSSFGRR